jgi:hypothetical protein
VIGENNIRLTNAHCSSNQLSTVALNTTFETLPQTYGKIAVYGNPGASTCETNIAVTRTWSVSNQ